MVSSYDKCQPAGYRLTLNDLQDQRHSLNMRLLLAIQSGDTKLQEILEQELSVINEKIDRMKGCNRKNHR